MGATRDVLARVRQPEYTGENRCLPCTAVNFLIALVVSLLLAGGGWLAGATAVGLTLGLVALGLASVAIYLRGYLVPGTPALTKAYLPERVLEWFGKAPEPARESEQDLDAEVILTGVGALEECRDGNDLCLTDAFRQAWYEEIQAVSADDVGRDRLLQLLDVDVEAGHVRIEEYGTAFRATVGRRPVGTWQSEAAFLADLGAAELLAERDAEWAERPVLERGQLLNGLRLFIDRCPSCGGDPEFGRETVESCCSTHEVAAVECGDCGARLFETRA
jgi:hypothetical protein